MKTPKFCFLGGDSRSYFAHDYIKEKGYDVSLYFFEKSPLTDSEKLPQDLPEADIYILPVPAFIKGELNAPYSDKKIKEDELIHLLSPDAKIFGGMISDLLGTDYLNDSELIEENASLTAEGTLEIILRETENAIKGAHFLVIGFGRIGKNLTKMLSSLGGKVSVATRSNKTFDAIVSLGATPILLSELKENLPRFSTIINTAPALILDRNHLEKVADKTLIIDLASRPGGCDLESAKELSKRVIWALSLPGKTAPKSAGSAIAKSILKSIGGDFFG